MTLQEFFQQHKKAAVAFSGGVDSAYLLYAAKSCGADVRAYYVKSEFQPQFEQNDAKRFAAEQGIALRVIKLSVLEDAHVYENPPERCYYCKQRIFSAVKKAAKEDGFSVLLDGTNASDAASDRPGMRVLPELSVHSPLRVCGLTKSMIRELSRAHGLFTWDKPAYACLATRIPAGEEITGQKLAAVEAAEDFLFSLGFTDFRVRTHGKNARIQLPEEGFSRLFTCRGEVYAELKKHFDAVVLDLEPRGGME